MRYEVWFDQGDRPPKGIIEPKKFDTPRTITNVSRKHEIERKRQELSNNQTRMHPSQPLNVIAGDGLDDPSPNKHIESCNNEKNSTNNKDIEEKKGDWKRYTEICDICQIDTIIGTCDHCGINLYCSGEYPEFPCQFDIKVRRRQ